ncbi:1,4-dihydroxy-2-naphthoate octaprenyltransferase [Maribacter thermophilus]|uniref:1,4-dihydroxy-2-naphthoate octaprenyltransferase n=1 Tax=Maribacter thermophilus TaxID=1197874 RepID=UPI00064150E5|nr:1,4-dihydroxy-2-naphthoate octaprenyltransferase [Maribacter thermophilus]
MLKFKAWVNAARLRTLPLSVSGIIVGAALAGYYGTINYTVFWLAILTTVAFQITSNFANDYGDGVKGTDNQNRIGPKRALQSGLLSRKSLKKGIIINVLVDLVLVIALLFFSFDTNELPWAILFLVLGGLSIWAAIKYTVGESAYGYNGLGDVFVFVFFGLVSVLGSMFLFIKEVPIASILPAVSVGLLSVGVLNLNNLRDHVSDKQSGKNTVVVKMGFEKGKKYHYIILVSAFMCMFGYVAFTYDNWKNIICLIAFIPVFLHLLKVKRTNDPVLLDPELKKLALSTFFMALLFYFSYHNFL